jgi:5-hydroxyisourate hydrolase
MADGRLTTHVLDTAHGCPAAGVRIELFRLRGGGEGDLVVEARTNDDGRLDAPLLGAGALQAGVYELAVHVGDYFAARGMALPQPPFLDVVPVRFGIAEADQHYHVPLLISPYGYATYRGS